LDQIALFGGQLFPGCPEDRACLYLRASDGRLALNVQASDQDGRGDVRVRVDVSDPRLLQALEEAFVDPAERALRRLDGEPPAVARANDGYPVASAQPIGHVHLLAGPTADLCRRLYNHRRVVDEGFLV